MFVRQLIALAREGKILFRQAARGVRGECERDPVPAHINIRLILRLTGEVGDGVDEFHGGGKILEPERAGHDSAIALPLRQGRERQDDSGFIQLDLAGGKTFKGFQTDLGHRAHEA